MNVVTVSAQPGFFFIDRRIDESYNDPILAWRHSVTEGSRHSMHALVPDGSWVETEKDRGFLYPDGRVFSRDEVYQSEDEFRKGGARIVVATLEDEDDGEEREVNEDLDEIRRLARKHKIALQFKGGAAL